MSVRTSQPAGGLECWIVRVAPRPCRIDGFPVDLRERRTACEAFGEIRIGDIGPPERDQVGKARLDQPVAALGIHVHVSNEWTAEDGTKVAKHSIARERFEGRSGKVG